MYFTGVSAMDVFIEHFGTPKADGSGGYEIKSADLSVMTSLINVGELVGSLTAAPLNDFLGRKGVFLVGAVTVIVGVVLQLSTAHSHAYIIGGRVILGYGVGAFSSTSPLYIGVSWFCFPFFSFPFFPILHAVGERRGTTIGMEERDGWIARQTPQSNDWTLSIDGRAAVPLGAILRLRAAWP